MHVRLILSNLLLVLPLYSTTSVFAAEAETIQMVGSEWHLRWSNEFSEPQKQHIKAWLQQAAQTATTLYGQFPLAEIRVELERAAPRAADKSPVPWGETMRRGVDGVRFVVDPTSSLASLNQDWTAPHELAHLFLPYLGSTDAWVAEGFASYYQNVLMARVGIYSPEEAWQELYEGFRRAQRDTNKNKSLEYVSRNRRESRATMRVYWSGALFFLEADLALRKLPTPRSLDNVIAEFISCCRSLASPPGANRWDGEELMRSFDNIIGSSLFRDLYRDYAESTEIPEFNLLFEQLGINTDDKKVVLQQAENSSIRDAIMKSTHKN